MSDDLATYIPAAVDILLAGLIPVSGYVDGSFVTITKDVKPFTSKRTADGTVSRLYNKDQTYTVSISLYSGSGSNDALTKLWQLDEISQRGKFPLLIKDSSGSDLFFSGTTWIEGIPPLVKSNTFDSRTWVLRSSSAVINIGGNGSEESLIMDLINMASSALPALQGLI
jgi:hypothetical protein